MRFEKHLTQFQEFLESNPPCVRIVVACRRRKAVGGTPTARPGATGAYSDGQELQRRI